MRIWVTQVYNIETIVLVKIIVYDAPMSYYLFLIFGSTNNRTLN